MHHATYWAIADELVALEQAVQGANSAPVDRVEARLNPLAEDE